MDLNKDLKQISAEVAELQWRPVVIRRIFSSIVETHIVPFTSVNQAGDVTSKTY
jgi:hypothetical protein